MPWKLFVVEPSDLVRVALRRYSGGSSCNRSRTGIHDVEVVIDPERLAALDTTGGTIPDEDDRSDPRWPKACACGYTFHPQEDSWQRNVDTLYKGSPDKKLYVIQDLPVGAMWDAWWFAEEPASKERYAGPDGKVWCVMTPCRVEWIVYSPSSDGKKWEVTGTPPLITVSPSIGINIGLGKISRVSSYHGHIKNGILTEDVDGRKFEGIPRTA